MGQVPVETRELIEELREFLGSFSHLKITRAILFGSRATGDYLMDSDIDLIMVSDDFTGVPFLERIPPFLRAWRRQPSLQPFCYTTEEFERKKEEIGLVNQALKQGIEVI